MMRRILKFGLLLALLLALTAYSTYGYQYFLGDASPQKLSLNKAFYEGKYVVFGIYPANSVSEDSITLSDLAGDYPIKIDTSKATMENNPSIGSMISVGGKSALQSKGYIAAEWVHVHEGFSFRYFPTLFALVLFGIVFLRKWKFNPKKMIFEGR